MKPFFLYCLIFSLYSGYSSSKESSVNTITSENLEATAQAAWLFIKPGSASLPLEMEILGKNQIAVQNLGIFNGISNTEKSIFFKLEKGVLISSSAIFATDKIKTPRNNLAINSALHFANGATYQFRDEASGSHSWDNLSGHNLDGTVVVNPGTKTHINGYASYDGSGLFTFPLGDGLDKYRPLSATGISGKTITTAWLPNDPGGNNDPTDVISSHSTSALLGDIKHIYPYGQWDWHVRSTSASLSNNTAPNNETPTEPISVSVNIPEDIDIITNGKMVNLRLAGWNGTAWESLNNYSIASGKITASVSKVFSSITLAAVDDPALPVVLVSFTAIKENRSAKLEWKTALETNSEYFDIERSVDGKKWNVIGTVLANGESQTLFTYGFIDQNPLNKNNYYRLKMVDVDESLAYSKILTLQFDGADSIVLFPNPASETLFIQAVYDWNTVKNVSIYDVSGKLIHSSSSATPLPNTLDVRHLSSGRYIVSITEINGNTNSYNIMVSR